MLTLNTRVAISSKRKRVGRGGDRGGTSGRGTKGQGSRSGGKSSIGVGFEGGQMPLHRRLPKRGFTNARFKKIFALVKLSALDIFSQGNEVTRELLLEKGLVKNLKYPIKILSGGVFSKKLVITVDACSESAMQAVSALGGEIRIIEKA